MKWDRIVIRPGDGSGGSQAEQFVSGGRGTLLVYHDGSAEGAANAALAALAPELMEMLESVSDEIDIHIRNKVLGESWTGLVVMSRDLLKKGKAESKSCVTN